jgi:predicted phosphodiesterase
MVRNRWIRSFVSVLLALATLFSTSGTLVAVGASIYGKRDYKRGLPDEEPAVNYQACTGDGTSVTFHQAFVKDVVDSVVVARALSPRPGYSVEGPGKAQVLLENTGKGEPGKEEAPFSFVVMGDTRKGIGVLDNIISEISGRDVVFAVHGGDLVDSGEEGEYERLMGTLNDSETPVFTVPGNHDFRKEGYRLYPRFLGPLKYYFDYGSVRFVFFGTINPDPSWRELEWLEEVLVGEKIVVFTHIPPVDPWDGMRLMYEDKEKARKFMDLMRERGVDLVCCSHIHDFATFSDGEVQYLITGGAGAPMPNPRANYHYVIVEFDGKEFHVEKVELRQGQRRSIARWALFLFYYYYLISQKYFRFFLASTLLLLLLDALLLYNWRKRRRA